MQAAAAILILGGLANLVYGLATGMVLGRIRETASRISKYQSLAHVGPIMWAPILLSSVVILPRSPLAEWIETLAAALLVASSVLLALKDTLHWIRRTEDEFAEKPFAFYLGVPMTLAFTVGIGILIVGAVQGLLLP